MKKDESIHSFRVDALFDDHWAPRERATLLFVFRDDEVLLIHKKRGLGAGKINGPGGRVEPGETPEQAAVREVQEEVGITPIGVRDAGRLRFRFTDGHSIKGYVFRAAGYTGGEPVETVEALPFWCPVEKLPYARMWADDRIWMPCLLGRRRFDGAFLFDGDRLLDVRMRYPDEAEAAGEIRKG